MNSVLRPIYSVPLAHRRKLAKKRPTRTAEGFAQRLVANMQATGRNAYVYFRDVGIVTAMQGTKMYARLARTTNYRRDVVGHFTPDISAEELADELREWFE